MTSQPIAPPYLSHICDPFSAFPDQHTFLDDSSPFVFDQFSSSFLPVPFDWFMNDCAMDNDCFWCDGDGFQVEWQQPEQPPAAESPSEAMGMIPFFTESSCLLSQLEWFRVFNPHLSTSGLYSAQEIAQNYYKVWHRRPVAMYACVCSFRTRSSLKLDGHQSQCVEFQKKAKHYWTEFKPKMAEEQKQGPFICSLCQGVLACRKNLNRHIEMHQKLKKFSCPVCGKRGNQWSNMKRHIKTHEKPKEYECRICGHRKKTEDERRLHEMLHVEKKCRFCGWIFERVDGLEEHECRGGESDVDQ